MTTATVLLLLVGLLGAIDIAYFHTFRGRLVLRPESRREAWIHVIRGFVYALQFVVIPNLRFSGRAFFLLVALFAVDASVALADVLEEPRSRASQGGLSGPEYLMHIVLSVLVGAMIHATFGAHDGAWRGPDAIAISHEVPGFLRLLAAAMAVSCSLVSLAEALAILGSMLPDPAPLHVRIRLRATLAEVWNVTQDHRLHPSWDHRFDRIEMLHDEPGTHESPLGTPDPRIRTGTLMRYEKRVLGLVIGGHGRYKLHRPMRQSTFEFWSDDPRSLIRRGVGLWLYRELPGGVVEFSTSYTYAVRWGPFGRLVDRFLFRPVFQRFTEQSFRRLAREWFHVPRPRVLGREGRRPRTFVEVA